MKLNLVSSSPHLHNRMPNITMRSQISRLRWLQRVSVLIFIGTLLLACSRTSLPVPEAEWKRPLASPAVDDSSVPPVAPPPIISPTPTPAVRTGNAAAPLIQEELNPGEFDMNSRRDQRSPAQQKQILINTVPIYGSFDFMSGYLYNLTSPILLNGRPWDYGSTNMMQLEQPGGGTSYWDYWSETETWDSPNHLWYDEQGNALTFRSETIKDAAGMTKTAFVLVDRPGPGVMDKLWFTHDPVRAFLGILTQAQSFFSSDSQEVTEWGSLSKLGNLRIEVDGEIAYDGPVVNWFSGEAQGLSAALRQLFVWRYREFGSDGNIIPIPYQKHLKISVYGGMGKPKWFMATGMTLPPGTLVESYTGSRIDLKLDRISQYARNVLNPENYLDTVGSRESYDGEVKQGAPLILQTSGEGMIGALRFQISKTADVAQLHLRVKYGDEVGIDVPFLAFFGEPDQAVLHHSTPIGIVDAGDNYTFYSNLPLPYQNGIKIELESAKSDAIALHVDVAMTDIQANTQLRIVYRTPEKLQVYGSDFGIDVPGNGKLIGMILVTKDQQYDSVPRILDKKITNQEDNARRSWPMGYLEGNLTLTDGAGNRRYYSGQEDWAEGGFYFNSGYTLPPGGSNRPFAGILKYKEGKDGYATLFRYFNDLSAFPFQRGLHLSFGHGTWNNNFPVSYGATVLYYHQVEGAAEPVLPALNNQVIAQPQISRRNP